MKVTTFTARPENATVKLVEGVRLTCPDLAISSPVEKTKVCDFVANLSGFPGVNAIYDSKKTLQRGLDINGAIIVRSDPELRR